MKYLKEYVDWELLLEEARPKDVTKQGKPMTKGEWIKKAKEIWGPNRFDYSEVTGSEGKEPFDMMKKVRDLCNDHKKKHFMVSPIQHINKNSPKAGCEECDKDELKYDAPGFIPGASGEKTKEGESHFRKQSAHRGTPNRPMRTRGEYSGRGGKR